MLLGPKYDLKVTS